MKQFHIFKDILAVLFRACAHPNSADNGVCLRGFPLRKYLENGAINPAWERLVEISPALARRTYHGDTLSLAYIPFVRSAFVTALHVENQNWLNCKNTVAVGFHADLLNRLGLLHDELLAGVKLKHRPN